MISLGEGNRIIHHCHVCGRAKAGDIVRVMGLTWKDTYAKGRDRFVKVQTVDRGHIALSDEEADLRNQAYSYLADTVELTKQHLEDLVQRGLDRGHIWSDGYFSIEMLSRNELGPLLLNLGEDLYKVPGFYLDVAGRPRFAAGSGLFIPVRDEQRRIIAGQIRTGGDPKYVWCRGSGSPRHIPLYVEVGETVWVTEGPLKADIASILSHLPVIAIPGVSAWKPLLPALKRWGTKRVVTAFDMDWDYNPQVKDQLLQLETALVRNGYEVDRAVWDIQRGKGIDDLLAAGFSPQIRERGDAERRYI